MSRKEHKKDIFEWGKVVVIAILLALVIRGFFITPIVVDGESMESTLNNQDRIIVSKISDLQRFDIIVFHADKKQDYIKRIIGLPGDKIEYKNDTLFINGKAYEEKYLEENKKKYKKKYGEVQLFTENFTLKELWGYDTVPENTLFVLGDNRPFSKDSRHINAISIDSVVGEAKIVSWPLKHIDLLK